MDNHIAAYIVSACSCCEATQWYHTSNQSDSAQFTNNRKFFDSPGAFCGAENASATAVSIVDWILCGTVAMSIDDTQGRRYAS